VTTEFASVGDERTLWATIYRETQVIIPDAPSAMEFEMVVKSVITETSSFRLRKSVENALAYADEILSRKNRGVAVSDLPLLFLQPELFANAPGVLRKHEVVMSGMRQSIQNLLKNFKLKG
jgi:hypothetical protein